MLSKEEKLELSNYRLNSAEENLKDSKTLFDLKSYRNSIGHSYYTIFSSMRAILALDGVDFKKHSGVISYFQREYIKSNILDKNYSYIIDKAFRYRSRSDYQDFYVAYKSDAEEQYNNAKEFLEEVKKYIENRIKEEREN